MQADLQSSSLESILNTTLERMQQLLKALVNETSALKNNDIEKVEATTAEKIILTEQIEESEKQRIHFLSTRGLDSSKPSEWLHNKKLNSLWKKIKNVSEKAQRQNQINGLVINGNRRQVETKIEILCASPPAVELVYSSSGENIKQRNSNTIARA